MSGVEVSWGEPLPPAVVFSASVKLVDLLSLSWMKTIWKYSRENSTTSPYRPAMRGRASVIVEQQGEVTIFPFFPPPVGLAPP